MPEDIQTHLKIPYRPRVLLNVKQKKPANTKIPLVFRVTLCLRALLTPRPYFLLGYIIAYYEKKFVMEKPSGIGSVNMYTVAIKKHTSEKATTMYLLFLLFKLLAIPSKNNTTL